MLVKLGIKQEHFHFERHRVRGSSGTPHAESAVAVCLGRRPERSPAKALQQQAGGSGVQADDPAGLDGRTIGLQTF